MVLRTVSSAGLLLLLLSAQIVFAQDEYSIRELKAGKFVDDSSYVYELPFAAGKKVWLVQAYESSLSHKGERALDFKIKKGTPIHAAREGVVESLRKDSKEGGLKNENLSDGNYISIRHDDGSVAHYWHLDFEVQGYDSQGNYKQLATRFRTTRGIKYLRPAKFYRRPANTHRVNN